MRNCLGSFVWVLFFSSIVLAVAGPLLAQRATEEDTAAIKFDVHDLSGIFRSVAGGLEWIGPNVPPLTPEGMAKLKEHISADRVPNPALSNDPQFRCNPQGFPRLWLD